MKSHFPHRTVTAPVVFDHPGQRLRRDRGWPRAGERIAKGCIRPPGWDWATAECTILPKLTPRS